MRSCLIISCSQRKKDKSGAAINVYDGNFFRILRKHKPRLDVFVLSAKYGLIPAHHIIEPYNQKLTPARASEIATMVKWQFREAIKPDHSITLAMMNDLYWSLVEPFSNERIVVRLGEGISIGGQQQLLVSLTNLPSIKKSDYIPAWIKAIE